MTFQFKKPKHTRREYKSFRRWQIIFRNNDLITIPTNESSRSIISATYSRTLYSTLHSFSAFKLPLWKNDRALARAQLSPETWQPHRRQRTKQSHRPSSIGKQKQEINQANVLLLPSDSSITITFSVVLPSTYCSQIDAFKPYSRLGTSYRERLLVLAISRSTLALLNLRGWPARRWCVICTT